MTTKTKNKTSSLDETLEEGNFQLEPPDGGWGYVVVMATVVMFCVTIVPTAAFGLVYGNFLKTLGDETTGTTLASSLFNTVSSFTGLFANGLLNTLPYRKVGLLGSVLFTVGAVGLIFSQNLMQLLTCYGVIEGIGYGLLTPALLSAFNSYFDKKMAVMMSVSQACVIGFNMVVPQLAASSMAYFGFRGTLTGLAILSLLTFPAAASLNPVKKYMKKVYTEKDFPAEDPNNSTVQKSLTNPTEKPLLYDDKRSFQFTTSQRSIHQSYHRRPRQSIVSTGASFASVINLNAIKEEQHNQDNKEEDKGSFWTSFVKSMDMSLLKDLRYLNISVGLGLAYTADMTFISIIPLMLKDIGFTPSVIAELMFVFFGCDVVSRILLTVISSVVKFKSRYVVLGASVLIFIARLAFVSNDSYIWKLIFAGVLGFLRCFIQTPLTLVISDEYQDKFSVAYSLWMFVNGVISLVLGLIMSLVKSYVDNNVLVSHVLTFSYLICVVSWTVELLFFRIKEAEPDVK